MKEGIGMSEKAVTKIYYRITFKLASALSVGSGRNRYSDSDVVRDSAGEPFIPGSSLAGVYRTCLSQKDADYYLGTSRKDESGAESRVLVYDAKLCGKEEISYRSVIRDCVALDEWKTGREGHKFDFEVVEPGAMFVTYLELNCRPGDRDIGKRLAAAWRNHQICIGRKTMRGLGSIGEVTVCRRSFELQKQEQLDAWLDFDMYREDDWQDTELKEIGYGCLKGAEVKETEDVCREEAGAEGTEDVRQEEAGAEVTEGVHQEEAGAEGTEDKRWVEAEGLKEIEAEGTEDERREEAEGLTDTEAKGAEGQDETQKKRISVVFNLKQKGGISIRRYTTQINNEKAQPDAEQLTCVMGESGNEVPYIPGTSWAGAFRHHMERLVPKCTEAYFGSCEKRSDVRFCESFLRGAKSKVLTRNAVDRFTGGVIENALFTEKMWYGGETVLRLDIPAGTNLEFRQALAASLTDLHMGLLSIGGLTSVGRGVFEGKELFIDQIPVQVSEKMYEDILEKL